MKQIAFVALSLILVMGCAHTGTSSAPVDIAGMWKGETNSQAGGSATRLAFNFIQDGESIAGAIRNETIQSGWELLGDIKIKGNRIYFTSSPKIYKGKMTFKYRGEIEGDKINMSYKMKDPVKMAGGDDRFDASEKVGRGGMFDVTSENIARGNFIIELTLTRVQ